MMGGRLSRCRTEEIAPGFPRDLKASKEGKLKQGLISPFLADSSPMLLATPGQKRSVTTGRVDPNQSVATGTIQQEATHRKSWRLLNPILGNPLLADVHTQPGCDIDPVLKSKCHLKSPCFPDSETHH